MPKISSVPYFSSKRVRSEIRAIDCRFISSAAPTSTSEDALAFIEEIRSEMPDATHHVYASLIGVNSPIQAWTDDGEPSGTAGRPVFVVLQNSGLSDITLVVTRYFGGTLLGSGGLVRAYSKAAREVLKLLLSKEWTGR